MLEALRKALVVVDAVADGRAADVASLARQIANDVEDATESAEQLLAVCKEIAESKCDLGDSERRIRLYHVLNKLGEL